MSQLEIPMAGIRMVDTSKQAQAIAYKTGAASKNALTAKAGGGQAGATQLLNGMNRVTVVASANDSVQLPPAFSGTIVWVKNADAADSMQVFGKEGRTDTINGTAGNVGVAQAAGITAAYACFVDGAWDRLLSA
jgi:hypothetical protein